MTESRDLAAIRKIRDDIEKRYGHKLTALAMRHLENASEHVDTFEMVRYVREHRNASRSWKIAAEIFIELLKHAAQKSKIS
jgi:hypothetical protein